MNEGEKSEAEVLENKETSEQEDKTAPLADAEEEAAKEVKAMSSSGKRLLYEIGFALAAAGIAIIIVFLRELAHGEESYGPLASLDSLGDAMEVWLISLAILSPWAVYAGGKWTSGRASIKAPFITILIFLLYGAITVLAFDHIAWLTIVMLFISPVIALILPIAIYEISHRRAQKKEQEEAIKAELAAKATQAEMTEILRKNEQEVRQEIAQKLSALNMDAASIAAATGLTKEDMAAVFPKK